MARVLRGLFGHRDFRLLLFGQSLSTVGDRLVFVALALYVTDIGTPSDVGIVLACHAVPLVGFLLIGGVWADRLPRHLVVVTTDLIRFALHGLLAVLIFTGAVEIWHIAVIEACFGTAEAFYRPAFTGLVPQTVPEDEIQRARAAFGTVETIAEFAGPALATALVLGVGPGWAFALDAATFLVSAAFLVRLRPRRRGEPGERTSVLAELRDGWTEVRSRTWIWVIVAAFSLALLPIGYVLAGPLGEALGAVEVLSVGSAIALAALAGALLFREVRNLRRLERVV
jgi:MFS family permease